MKKYTNLIVKLIISGTLLGFIFYNLDAKQFIDNFKLLNLNFVPLIILTLIANYIISSYRWKALLIHKNSENISVKYLVYLYFTGAFFNNFMPTSIGGDVYKVVKLGKKIKNNADAFSSTFMERFTGVIALGLISVISLINILKFWGVVLFIGLWVGIYFSYKTLQFLSKKSKKVEKIYASINAYKGQYRVLKIAFATSFLVQFLAILTQYLIFYAMGITLPFGYSFFIFPIITLAGFFVPSINGVGVQDSLYMNLFSVVGVATSLSLSASVIYHLFRLGVSLIGGVLYAFSNQD